jgi:hypothetical protein
MGDWYLEQLNKQIQNQTQTSNTSTPSANDWYLEQLNKQIQNQASLNQPAWYQQAFTTIKQGGEGLLQGLGTVLRPLSAPQQVLFGVLAGDPVKGLRAASNDFVSWFAKPFSDERITGKELVESASRSLHTKGMPDAVSKWGGLALDIIADPALLLSGGAALAGKLGVSSRVVTGLNKGAAVLNAPLKVAFQALPKVTREKAAQTIYDSFLGRTIGSEKGTIPRQSVAEFLLPADVRKRMLPEQVSQFEQVKTDALAVGRAAGNNIAERINGLEMTYDTVLKHVPVEGRQAFREVLNDFVTFKNPNDAAKTWAKLVDLGNQNNIDPLQLWDVLSHSTRVNTLGTGIMSGTSKLFNDLMQSRLGVDKSAVQKMARIKPETARLRLGIPEPGLQSNVPVYDDFGVLARAEADKTLTSTLVVNSAELLNEISVRRGFHREFAILGADGDAQIERVRALNRPVTVDPLGVETQVKNLATPVQDVDAVKQSILNEVSQPGVRLIDALANVRRAHGLTGDQTKELLDGLLFSSAVIPSSAESAISLRNFRAKAETLTRGIPSTGAAGMAEKRNDALTERMLDDLGVVKDVLANAYKDASTVGREAAFQAKVLSAKKFLDDNGLYTKPMEDLPAGAKINGKGAWAAPGYVTVSEAMSQATNGVLETGAVVPDFVAREFTVATKFGGEAGSSVLHRVMSDWQVIKLSNPPTIVQNVVSNTVQASTYVPHPLNPFELVAGLRTRFTETAAMKDARLTSGLGSWSEDMMGLKQAVDTNKRVALDVKQDPIEQAWTYFEDLIGKTESKNPLVPRVGDVATLGATYAGRNLFRFYKATEDRMRDAAYYAYLKKGMKASEAADHATQIFFDYSARPGLVDAMSKLGGLSIPFQTYPNLATWRTLSTLYDKPAFLRAQTQGYENLSKTSNNPNELAASESWLGNAMPLRIGQDSKGRGLYVPLSQFLPMGAASAIADNVNNSVLGPIPMPPMLSLGLAVFGGRGFRGKEVYQGVGSSFNEAYQNDPAETTRLALKELWKFGVYPWAPGTPVAERLTKAIMANGKTLDQLEQEAKLPQGALQSFAARVGVNGPLLWSAGSDPVGVSNPLVQPASDLTPALQRVLGLRSYEVQGDLNQPGAARSTALQANKAYKTRVSYWKYRVQSAPEYAQKALIEQATKDLESFGIRRDELINALTQ